MTVDEEPRQDGMAQPAGSGEPRRRWRRFRTAPKVGRPGALRSPTLRPLRDFRWPDALQNPIFRSYWLSQIVALAGTWMQQVGIQLVVLSLTTSALAIGMINIVAGIPMLLLSLTGGVIADQFDRRKILITAMSILGCFSIIYALLIGTGTIQYWHILVFAALGGVVASFQLPASQAFVSDLVERDHLPEAIALNSASFNSTRIVGPALAASAIGILGLASAFIVNAITLLAPISTLLRIGKRMTPRPRSTASGSQITALKEGLDYVRGNDGMFGLILLQATYSFFVSPTLLVLLALFVTDSLGGGDSWVGLMLSFLGAGSLAGALVLLRGSRRESAASKRMIVSAAGLTICLAWMAVSQNPLMAVPGVMIGGFAFSMGNSQINTRLQQVAPEELRGRVMSLASLAFNGVMPFATLAISSLAQVVGMHVVLGISAVGLGACAFFLWKRYAWKAFQPEIEPGSGAQHAL